jgi:hypothetical protein
LYERRLIDYIPHIIRDVREYKAILTDGEDTEIESLWASLDDALKDQFIMDSTEYGVSRWERLLKITPKATATLDERKFTILTKINEQIPFTITTLKEQLISLCGGEENVLVDLDANAYHLRVLIAVAAKSMYEDIGLFLRRIVPANLTIEMGYLYNRHMDFRPFTHGEMGGYTHEQLRNDTSITFNKG